MAEIDSTAPPTPVDAILADVPATPAPATDTHATSAAADAPATPAPARVGVRDVARLAGVSSQTVSRVINEHASIRPETREKVLAAIATLDYRVNNAARALGTSTTRTLGVIASDAHLYGPSAGIAAIETAARAAGKWVATAYADAADQAAVRSAVRHLLAQGVDGVILVAPHAPTFAALAAERLGVPLVALHGPGAGAERQIEGVGLVVDHLVDLGHRRIALLAGPGEWLETTARVDGFERSVAAHDLPPAPRWVGDWSAAAGARIAADAADAVRAPDGPTAIVVANDQMALGLIAGLRARGLDVPGDVSVAGFDDNPDAAFYRPSLTTVHVDMAGEARRCVAEVLTDAGSGGSAASVIPAAPSLVVRASTAPPASASV